MTSPFSHENLFGRSVILAPAQRVREEDAGDAGGDKE